MKYTASVAMCTFNGEKYLQEQLDSLANQTVTPNELVVCDDCSTDNTIQILEKFKSQAPFTVKIIQNESRIGVVQNFSNAIVNCTQDIIFLSDQDDYWQPTRIEKMLQQFEIDPRRMVVSSNAVFGDDKLNPIPMESMLESRLAIDKYFNKMANGYLTTKNISLEAGCSMALQRGYAHQIFPVPLKEIGYDIWISNITPFLGIKYFICEEPLFIHRLHNNNCSWSLVNKQYETQRNIEQVQKENKKFYARSLQVYWRSEPIYKFALNFSVDLPKDCIDSQEAQNRKEELLKYMNYLDFRRNMQRHFWRSLGGLFSRECKAIYRQCPQPVLCQFYDLWKSFVNIPKNPLHWFKRKKAE